MFTAPRIRLLRFAVASTSAVAVSLLASLSLATPLHRIHCDSAHSAHSPTGSYLANLKKDTVGRYENKLRSFAHPLKLFNYFASVTKNGEKLMTVQDFIRSIIPYRSHINQGHIKRVHSAEEFFHLADMDGDGYINFNEFMIFLTLLGTPEYQWKLSFKLFDTNSDFSLQKSEFEDFMRQHTSALAISHKLGTNQHLNFSHTGLSHLFFGEDGTKSVPFEVFFDFMKRLHLEVLKLEYHQFDVDDKGIGLRDFGRSIISYANEKKLNGYVKRVDSFEETSERISFQQFYEFDQMIKTRLHDIGMAYRFYRNSKSRAFGKPEFKRIIKAVTKLELTDGQTDLIFHIFDSSGDNVLDSNEFFETFKARQSRGLDSVHNMGIFEFWHKVWDCTQHP